MAGTLLGNTFFALY
ncbi:Protein of unknown function [Bacillus cereus]|nr:Protein of unknown function [Bacillus cereus]